MPRPAGGSRPGVGGRPSEEKPPDASAAPSLEPANFFSRQKARLALESAFPQLATTKSGPEAAEKNRARLERLKKLFHEFPPEESVAAIVEELESGRDMATGLPFEVGEEGLSSAPTWRVHLLDLLGSIDPSAAADYARNHIFSAPSSADEWAISLRGILLSYPARKQEAAREEIGMRLEEMLQRDDWRATASAGLLESLDFLPHTPRPADLLPILTKWLGEAKQTNPDLAVQIALERAATTRPRELLPALAADASLLGASPAQRTLRASLMARADLGDPVQASALRSYLESLDPASEESMAFFRLFPERRYSVAPGLASQPSIRSAVSLVEGNNSALAVFPGWLNDPALAKHAPSLLKLVEKLNDLGR